MRRKTRSTYVRTCRNRGALLPSPAPTWEPAAKSLHVCGCLLHRHKIWTPSNESYRGKQHTQSSHIPHSRDTNDSTSDRVFDCPPTPLGVSVSLQYAHTAPTRLQGDQSTYHPTGSRSYRARLHGAPTIMTKRAEKGERGSQSGLSPPTLEKRVEHDRQGGATTGRKTQEVAALPPVSHTHAHPCPRTKRLPSILHPKWSLPKKHENKNAACVWLCVCLHQISDTFECRATHRSARDTWSSIATTGQAEPSKTIAASLNPRQKVVCLRLRLRLNIYK